MNADDVALTSYKQILVIKHTIFKDLNCVSAYYRKWHLKLSATKSVSSIFHLRNCLAQYQLQVHTLDKFIPFDPTPRYLGVTLDRWKSKMTSRAARVKQLAGLNWGACFDVLCMSTLLLIVTPAEYFSLFGINFRVLIS